jgi:sugar lactone lactonase YvrE
VKRLAAILAAACSFAAPASASAACVPWTETPVASGLGSLENLAFDKRGGMLVSASDPNAILRLKPDGSSKTFIPNVNAPGGIRVRKHSVFFNTGDSLQSGTLGTADGTIDRYDLRTRKRRTWADGLVMPNGLAFLPNGDAVVSRDINGSQTGITRIRRGDRDNPELSWSPQPDSNGLVVSPDGKFLYTVETFTPTSRIFRIRISDPSDIVPVVDLADPLFKGLDDMTRDQRGRLYVAANPTGEVIRVNPETQDTCVIAAGLMLTSSVRFGQGPGWSRRSLYVTGFDGAVRRLTPPSA